MSHNPYKHNYSPYTYYSRSHPQQPSPQPPHPSPPPKKIHINPNFTAPSSSSGGLNSEQPVYVNVSNPSASSNSTSKVIVNPKVTE